MPKKLSMSRALEGSTEWVSELMAGQADRVGEPLFAAMERHVAAVKVNDRAYFGGLRAGLETSVTMLEVLQKLHPDHRDAEHIATDLDAYLLALA